jgi:uncharacterized protein YkwD
MKTHPYTQILGVLCAAVFTSCATPPATTRVPVSASMRTDNPAASRVHEQVNAYRQSKGRSALQRHAGLDRLAQQHCEYLRKNRGTFSLSGKNVSHYGFEGRALYARESFSMNSVSENVAATSRSSANPAPVLLELWKNSKSHHQNMLESWTHTGVGVVVDSDGMVFSTQLFATMALPSQMALRERFNRF